MAAEDCQWKLYTCERLFEPPLISTGGGVVEERLSTLQASISFPGFSRPDYKEAVNSTTLLTAFLAMAGPVLEAASTQTERSPGALHKELLAAIQESGSDELQESAVMEQWLEKEREAVEEIIESAPSYLLSARLAESLVRFHQ